MTTPKRRRFSWWILALPLLLAGAKLQQNADVKIVRDVVYGKGGNETLLLDVFHPPKTATKEASTRAAVLLVHGGGWQAGDKRDFDDLGRGLARAGYVAFSANYRLVKGKDNPFPAQLDDVQRAVRWIRSRASTYKIDAKKLAAIGGSAGGHLVALLGTRDTRDNSDKTLAKHSSRVACVVDINGPTDLTVKFPIVAEEGDLRVEDLVVALIGKARTNANLPAYRDASPMFHIDKKTVPFLIFHGAKDSIVPVAQSQKFHEALRKNGTSSELVIFPNAGHGFSQKEEVETLILKMFAFLETNLPTKTPAP